MTPRKKQKRKRTNKEKLVIILALIIVISLSFIVSVITQTQEFGSTLEPLQTDTQEFNHNGSAVRKETQIRKDYEKDYRQKNEKWDDQYSKILENKEDDKKLEKLNLKDTTKNEN